MTRDMREALHEIADRLDHLTHSKLIAEQSSKLRALADAPPTVAELLALVDETHEVRWSLQCEERRAINAGSDSIAIEYSIGGSRWFDASLTVSDLTQPATLVEVPHGR